MPKRTDISKIMVIGSGPIVIGQAAEFDYAGTQACLALKEEGYEKIFTVGHSLGGAIVLKVATEVKDLITGTYLLCGSAKFDSLGEEFLEGLKEGKILLDRVRPGVALVASPINEYDEIVLEDESVFIKDFNIDITVNFEHELNKIETPVGLVVGDKDELILPYMINTMESKIKDFEKTIYGPVGHILSFAEKQEVSKLIEDFIIRHSR